MCLVDFKPGSAVVPQENKDEDEEDEDEDTIRSNDDIRISSRTLGGVTDPEDGKLITASEAGATSGSGEEPRAVPGATTPGELEEEADQQGAFNAETGEINWDCPCLGGMAHGPCGEEFRSAFSCFVYSVADPKGVDCIDKFKAMQDCFRKVGRPLDRTVGWIFWIFWRRSC